MTPSVLPLADKLVLMLEAGERVEWTWSEAVQSDGPVGTLQEGEPGAFEMVAQRLGLRQHWRGSWEMEELRGKNNREVPEELRDLVKEWIRTTSPASTPTPKPARVEPSRHCLLPRPGEDDPQIAAALEQFRERLGGEGSVDGGDRTGLFDGWEVEDEVPS